MRTPIILGEQETVLDASIGGAVGDGTHDRSGDLLRKVDLALYRAKAGYEVFDPSLDERITS